MNEAVTQLERNPRDSAGTLDWERRVVCVCVQRGVLSIRAEFSCDVNAYCYFCA